MDSLKAINDTIVCRYFDIYRILDIMLEYDELHTLYLCFAYDKNFRFDVVVNGEWVNTGQGFIEYEIPESIWEYKTLIDIPCIYYVMKNGEEGKLYCFEECLNYIDEKYKQYNFKWSLRNRFFSNIFIKHRMGKLDLINFENDKENKKNLNNELHFENLGDILLKK